MRWVSSPIRCFIAAIAVFVLTQIAALGHGHEAFDYHWADADYSKEMHLQMCAIGASVAILCLLTALWGIIKRRRAS